jgi:branched-chain amino acid transport system substrate-binding protein
MLRRASSVLLVFIAVLLAGCRPAPPPFACADTIGCVEIAPAAPIEIGVLQVLSGDQELLGLNQHRSVELARDDRSGELLGHPLELHIEDSLCSKEGGATAAARIVANPQIVGILGPTCSGAAAGAIKIVSEAGLTMISGSSTAPSLTAIAGKPGSDWWAGFLRTAQNDAYSGQAAAAFAFEALGVTRAATINDGDPYTQGLTTAFEQAFAALGGEIVLSATVNKGDSNMEPVLTAVLRSGADLVFLPVFSPEADHLVLQARSMEGLGEVTLLSAEGFYQDTFIEAVGEAGVGLHMVIPSFTEGPDHAALVARYQAKYGEGPTRLYYAHTYDAANLLFQAIEEVAAQDEDATLYIGRQALRDALYGTTGFRGLTGSLSCDEYGDCGVARFQVVRLDDPAAGLEGLAANVVYTYPPEP